MPWMAVGVHLFTALGAVCALFATLAIFDGAPERVFFWLAIALIIDGIDGTFARAAHVKESLPRFSGEILDLVVDYLTYVFVPVLALISWRHLEGPFGMVLAAGILLSSLYHFADTDSKDADYCFVGFPALWNGVAFLVFAWGLPSWATALLVLAAIGLAFVPMPWVHPLRVTLWRWPTAMVLSAGALAAMTTLYWGFPATPINAWVLAITALYLTAFSFFRYLQKRG